MKKFLALSLLLSLTTLTVFAWADEDEGDDGWIEQPPRQNIGAFDANGTFYAPAGEGYINTRDGTLYVPAGPNGVINTRTGEFIPTN
jgi:hypothetical protein